MRISRQPFPLHFVHIYCVLFACFQWQQGIIWNVVLISVKILNLYNFNKSVFRISGNVFFCKTSSYHVFICSLAVLPVLIFVVSTSCITFCLLLVVMPVFYGVVFLWRSCCVSVHPFRFPSAQLSFWRLLKLHVSTHVRHLQAKTLYKNTKAVHIAVCEHRDFNLLLRFNKVKNKECLNVIKSFVNWDFSIYRKLSRNHIFLCTYL